MRRIEALGLPDVVERAHLHVTKEGNVQGLLEDPIQPGDLRLTKVVDVRGGTLVAAASRIVQALGTVAIHQK